MAGSQPDLDEFVDEQRACNAAILERAANMPSPGTVDVETIRRSRLFRSDGSFRPALFADAYDAKLVTSQGSVLTRVFPGGGADVAVHFHGGGWVLGSIYEQDSLLADIGRRTAVTVVSVDYPLAPETRLPVTLEVAAAALRAVVADYPEARVCVIGESAGAHIALMSVMRLRAYTALFCRIKAMSLSYGIYDLSMTPSQRLWGDAFLGLSTPWLEWFYTLALPDHTRDARSDPELSPLYADLNGLPPTLFGVGSADPLLDDSLFLFQRWQAAGNTGKLQLYPEAPHGFNHAPTGMARRYNDRIIEFLAEALISARLPQ